MKIVNCKINSLVKSLKTLFSVIPAPYQVRGKLQQESSLFGYLETLWIPVSTPAR
jgi:hypothetical protein